MVARKSDRLSATLLAWYDTHRRRLPWRAEPGTPGDSVILPYRVWLSEIMLQQTTVAAAAGYYGKFIARWPDVQALAAAELDEVLGMWSGLGYYARARNLHKCAKAVAATGGRFPNTLKGLKSLPGIGDYTAGAIGAIAFGIRAAAMDANAERVIARVYAVEEPLPAAKARLRDLCLALVPEDRPGDFAQSLMDLGATVCTMRPACEECPLTDHCLGRRKGIASRLPVKAKKKARPVKRGAAFVAICGDRVLLRKRPEKGLLGGMLEPPLGPWSERFPSANEAAMQAPFAARWKKLPGTVRHVFTHFELLMDVYVAKKAAPPAWDGAASDCAKTFWVPVTKLSEAALPTVMRKILGAAGLGD